MSSPIRRTNSRPSPSRNTPNGFRRSQANGNGVHSPYRTNLDSPSRLIEEFSKVYIDDEKAFRKRLDEQADEQERLHRQALEQSLKEHEQVRQSAERAREKLQFEIQRMKVQRAEDERIALDKERQRTVEAEAAAKQRELEAVQRREEALQQAAQKQREVEEAQRRIDVQKKQVEEDKAKREAERTQREEADRKSREDAAANERAIAEQAARKAAQPAPPAAQPKQQTPTPAPQTNGVHAASSTAAPQAQGTTASVSAKTDNGVLSPTGILTPMQEREAEHKRYMDLHKQLKVMRSETLEQAQQLGFKAQLGNMRRDIKKVMGQLNKVDKTANKPHMMKVREVLKQAAQMQQVMVDITPYLVSMPPGKLQEAGSNTQYPAALLFLLNHFAKSIINQLASEASRDTNTADPIGILAVTIFAAPEFLFSGHSLIDILWAKYHKVCPVLFGIYGTEKTHAGRARLGWRMDEGAEVNTQDHYDNMTGLAAGFSAITLRDFTKSANKSPAPVHLFWTSLARILNTPNNEQTPTHYVVLNYMLKNSVPRFIGFYGMAAIAALRTACIGFPSGGGPLDPSGTGSSPFVLAVQSLPDNWQRDLNLTL